MTLSSSEPPRSVVVIGLLGTTLDAGDDPFRWRRWRPTVALGQHESLLIERFELIYQPASVALFETIEADLGFVAPEAEVRANPTHIDDPWDFEQVYGALYDLARRMTFDTDREEYLVHITTGTHVAQICLFLLTEARHFPARLIQASPPPRGAASSPGSFRVIDLDLSRYDQIATRSFQAAREGLSFLKFGIQTRNDHFNALIEQLERVASASRAPLLLSGPTGAGKTRLARRIYELRRARHHLTGRLVEVNCATLRGDQAMAALFGHVRGAFTGAHRERPGLLRAASGGLLFLDEIGELGLDEQAMLLRALECKTFLPVGADEEVASDFQLIAGTNRDLREAVRAGRFREDLLARINLWTFTLPGLAQRPEDIEPNLDYELDQFAAREGRKVRFNREARRRFLTFARDPSSRWRGNFRDLNAAVIRMSTLSPSGRITVAAVDAEITRLHEAWAPAGEAATRGEDHVVTLREVLDEVKIDELDLFDQLQLARVIAVCRQSKSLSAAGRRLFQVSRTQRRSVNDSDRLRKYLARFGLSFDGV